LAANDDCFLELRNKFIKNYAALSICLYTLGIGDRHLDNFLYSFATGEVVAIDFGYSFGAGV
jgi:DNA-dependent protein kinase catalytic subunit